jgi:hypothetical protein
VISQIKAEQRQSEMRQIVGGTADMWQTWVRLRTALSMMQDVDGLEGLHDDLSTLDSLLIEHRRELSTFLKG